MDFNTTIENSSFTLPSGMVIITIDKSDFIYHTGNMLSEVKKSEPDIMSILRYSVKYRIYWEHSVNLRKVILYKINQFVNILNNTANKRWCADVIQSFSLHHNFCNRLTLKGHKCLRRVQCRGDICSHHKKRNCILKKMLLKNVIGDMADIIVLYHN